jgi:acyl carrier protein
MEREEIKNQVKGVIAKVLEIDESEISDNANFSFDLGASSLKSIQLVADARIMLDASPIK